MIDNRFDCLEECKMTHDDETNKCDGHCIGTIADRAERLQRALEHNK